MCTYNELCRGSVATAPNEVVVLTLTLYWESFVYIWFKYMIIYANVS